jgi:multidrug efflux pump subunit AcrA (membrane-fusion protein)
VLACFESGWQVTPLTTVSTIDPIKVYYNVTEQAYIELTRQLTTENDPFSRLRQLEIDLILTDGTLYPLKGKIYAADRQIGVTSGALRIEALFPKPSHSLRPGEFARVRIKQDLIHDSILVPHAPFRNCRGAARWRLSILITRSVSKRCGSGIVAATSG